MLRKMGNKLERLEEEIFEGRSAGGRARHLQRQAGDHQLPQDRAPAARRAAATSSARKRYIADDLDIYFDDINDASERIWDMLENYKEVVEALEATNESVISHQLNDVLRVLTALSVVFLPLTLDRERSSGMNVDVPGEE